MASKSENRRINLYINGKEVKNDIKSIRSEYNKAINELSKMTLGSKEYYNKVKDVNKLKGILDEHRKNLGMIQNAWQNFKTQMGGWIAGGFGLLAAGQIFRSFFSDIKAFEKAASNLSALTGLMGDDLKYLKDQALGMSSELKNSGILIQQSATDILEAFKIVGSAKPELLKNKEALAEVTKQAIVLSEAAGMELVPAVDALTLTMNQFGAPAMEAGRYINVLAAGAKEGAAEIPDLTDSMREFGTVAKMANISIEQSVGLVETLGEKGLKERRAGTGVRNVLLELMSGADDTNPKIVGLNKALENLANKNLTAAEMTKMFGKENYIAAQILIENRKRVDELTGAVTKTSTAYEQAAINTDNLQGSIDNLKSGWSNFLISLNNGSGWLSKFFRGVVDMIGEAVDEWKRWTMSDEELALDKKLKADQEFIKKFQENNKLYQEDVEAEWQSKLDALLTSFKMFGDHYSEEQKSQMLEEQKNIYHHLDLIKKAKDDINKQNIIIEPLNLGASTTSGGGGNASDKPKAEKFDPSKIGSDEIASIIELNKQKQEAYKEGREQIIIDLQKSYDKEANIRQIAHNEELTALGTNEDARKALDEKFKKDEAASLAAHLNELVKKVQEILSTGGIEGLGIEEAMLTDEEKESLLGKIDELKVKVSELNAEAAGLNADGEKRDPLGMTEDDWDSFMEHVQQAGDIAFQLGDIWNSINQRIANEENANLANYEKNTNTRKKALENQLKKGLISQEKYNNEVAALDSNLDAEKRKIEIAQAKRFRAATIFQILANGAMAAINALATTQPFILGLAMAALAAIATGAAIAAVPPVPAYAEGGYTKGDKMYRAGEKGKEWIAPNWMAEHPYIGPVIRDLESIRAGAAPETVFRSPVVPEYTTSSTSGSSLAGSSYQSSTLSESKLNRMIEQNDELIKFFKDPENRKSYIRWDDLTKYSKEIQTMQDLSGF